MKGKKSEPLLAVERSRDEELPEGWRYVTILDVCEVNPPKPPKDFLPPDALVTFVPMPAVDAELGAITDSEVQPYLKVRSGFSSFRDGDVIMAKITPCMENGKAAIIHGMKNGIGFGSTEFHVMRPHGEILPEYLYYYIRQVSFRKEAENHFTGSVGQKRVPADFIKQSIIPLPPLAEQQRIVARIEALLTHVNEARGRLGRVPAIMKKFRQTVLAAACSGRLTEGWREENPDVEPASNLLKNNEPQKKKKKRAGRLWGAGKIPELNEEERDSLPLSWTWAIVKELGEDSESTVQVGPMSMQSKTFTEKGVPVLNVGCVQWGYFDESKLDFMPEDVAQGFSCYKILKNDLLFTRSGTVGRCAIASDKQNGYLMTFHLLRVRPSIKKCLPEYMQFVFWGAPNIKRQTEAGVIGSTRDGFNTNLLASLNVPLPPLTEQHEIVRRVDALFVRADAIEREVAEATKRTEALTQAVLGKAFRGELVNRS